MACRITLRFAASLTLALACSSADRSVAYPNPMDADLDGDPATAGDSGVSGQDPQVDAFVPARDGGGGEPGPMAREDAGVGATDAAVVDPPAGGAIMHGKDPTSSSASGQGEFTVGQVSSGIRNGSAFGDNPVIYYPTDAQAPLSLVAVIPGYGAGKFYVQSWAPFLASHGFAVILLDPNSNYDNPGPRADALLDAIESLKAENARDESPLKGKLDGSRVALMGHSMGGGGTHVAANRTPSLKAAIPLSAWNTTKSFSMTQVPILEIAGSADGTAPADEHARPFYDSIPDTTTKMYIEIQGGNHNVSDSPGKNAVIARYSLSWLKVFVDGDERYRQFLLQTPTGTAPNGFDTTL